MSSLSDSHSIQKSEIRQQMRSMRRRLSDHERSESSSKLCQQLNQWQPFRDAKEYASYLSQDGELSTQLINQLIWQTHKKLYLPVLRPLPPNRLWFAPCQQDTPLIKNKYGIHEPDIQPWFFRRISFLDIVLFPLVAFDAQGGRLGMGGGFYDRTFQHVIRQNKRPLFIGIAYSQQRVDVLPTETWDIPLDAVATPEKIWLFE